MIKLSLKNQGDLVSLNEFLHVERQKYIIGGKS